MQTHTPASREDWLKARLDLLQKEKELTRSRDALAAARRELPWVKLENDYIFDGGNGPVTLAQLFDGSSQLIVYHFMYPPEWEAGCKSCSFWADQYNAFIPHLRHRDANLVAISRAPLAKLQAFKQRMGWSFTWVSSASNNFNRDFGVTFTPEQVESGELLYNYGTLKAFITELPGLSVFALKDGAVHHTYSTYARGLDILNGAYHHIDMLPKGRDEAGKNMAWLRLKDSY